MSGMNDLKKNNKDRAGLIVRSAFRADAAKIYILTAMIAFHIVPLVLALAGKTAHAYINSVLMFYFDPLIVFALLLIYGIRIGFNYKMPLIVTLLAAISTIMYYNGAANTEMGILYYPLLTLTLALFAYGAVAFLGVLAGAVIQHFKIF